MRILIAEDDPTSARYLGGLLARLGECVVVADGEECLAAFIKAQEQSRPFDLVCLDIMMPRMDGQVALQLMRQAEKERGIKPSAEVKVIMTTALGDVRSVMSAYKEGATSYITKPVAADRLFETIRSLGIDC